MSGAAMGGYGSGRPNGRRAKRRVEECVVFDLDYYLRLGCLDGDRPQIAEFTWKANNPWYGRPGPVAEDVHAAIGFAPAKKVIVFVHDHLQDPAQHVNTFIRLSQSQLPWGASRWWMHCPHASYAHEGYCGKRVRKLYLTPTSRHLGCRSCHELTYTSRAESRSLDATAKREYPDGSIIGATMIRFIRAWGKRPSEEREKRERKKMHRKRRRMKGWS